MLQFRKHVCLVKELGFGHQFAAQEAIDVQTGDFDGRVVFEEGGELLGGELGGLGRRHGGSWERVSRARREAGRRKPR